MYEYRRSTKIIVIDEGKIVGIGNHAQLIESCSVYNELYKQEIKEYWKSIEENTICNNISEENISLMLV